MARLAQAAAAACLTAALALPAQAQGTGTQATMPAPGWSFEFTPYIWAAGINGTATFADPRRDRADPRSGLRDESRNVRADFGDTLSNLSGFAFMGTAEARIGRFGVVADLVTLNIKENFSTPRDALFRGGQGQVSTTMGSVFWTMRALETERQYLDLGAGFQPFNMSTRATLNTGLLEGGTTKASAAWIDPALYARYRYRFAEAWSVTAMGTLGGFGVGSQLTWQAAATVDWRVANWVDLRAGWRYFAIDYQGGNGRLQYDGALSGPMLAATFRF